MEDGLNLDMRALTGAVIHRSGSLFGAWGRPQGGIRLLDMVS